MSTDKIQKSVFMRAKITPACVGCGACLGFSEYIAENVDGTAAICGTGIIPQNAQHDFHQVIAVCPVGAIVLEQESSQFGSVEKLKAKIIGELIDFKIPYPDSSQFGKDLGMYLDSVPLHKRSGWEYSSDGQAENRGLDEFNTIAYSRMKIQIQERLVQYKMKYLTPYYRYEQKPGNFYFDLFQEYSKKIEELLAQMMILYPDMNVPANFSVCEPPDFSEKALDKYQIYWMEHFEECIFEGITDEFKKDHPLGEYKVYINTSDIEVNVGTGNKYKPKTKYGYDLQEILQTYTKDLLWLIDFRGGCRVSDSLNDTLDCVLEHFKNGLKQKGKYLLSTLK